MNNYGDFLIRSNGELCHNIVEYEKVDKEELGNPGVIWNGTEYARIINKEWRRLDFTGELQIKTQIIAPKTDADVKINFNFKNGYVLEATPDVLLIDNTERLKHTDYKIKVAIKRAKRMNTWYYKLFKNLMINPLINICIYLRYPLIVCQDGLVELEKKLKKIL